MQTAPLQQPLAHDVASQTQVPPWQRWPFWQGGPPAQRQVPSTAQVSALLGSQAVHTAAPIPHAETDRGKQVEPEQQPVAQLPGLQLSQTPRVQPPTAQVAQASPPPPQAVSLLPGKQVVPEQQPLGQLVPSQTQAPARQRWPLAQAAPVPQRQVPPAEQPSASIALQTIQAAPGAPHASTARGLQVPPAQQPSGQIVASHPTVTS